MFKIHEVDGDIRSAYGMTVADMNGNGKLDIVAGSTGIPMIAWYEAPEFKKHVVSESHPGNICIAARDLTGNGLRDLIVGSGFNRRQRIPVEYLQWFEAKEDGESWESHFIEEIPYIHRLALADVCGNGVPHLFVASLQGGEGKIDEWQYPGGLWCYRLPEDPVKDMWEKRLVDGELHLNHGMSVGDVDGDGRQDVLIGCRDGLIWFEPPEDPFAGDWHKWVISERESSEVFTVDLDGDGVNEFLSIEPWHGNELVWYKAEGDIRDGKWTRHMIDDTLNRGHSVEGVDVDGDGEIEVIAGYNGPGKSLHIYRQADLGKDEWNKGSIDAGGMGMGQMAVLDMDGDGQLDIVASGMSSGNVRWYENEIG